MLGFTLLAFTADDLTDCWNITCRSWRKLPFRPSLRHNWRQWPETVSFHHYRDR